ncbi:MAG: hypothetical protein JNM56_36170 [Planctomycetia bacterium]|nr:hypothetical protein [Planctomycetia bacterium]
MSNDHSILSVLPASPDWGRWKRLAILAAVGGLVVLGGLLTLWHTFFSYVHPGQHLVVVSKFGKPIQGNRLLAEPGEIGVQRAVQGEGWHLIWPILYDSEVHQNTVIPAGQVGIVTAKGGEPLPPGEDLAEAGQQGIQRQVLLPGEYRLNRYGYDVEIVPAVEIRPGFVGVQRRLLGRQKGIQPEVLQPGRYYLNTREIDAIEVEVGIYQTPFKYDTRASHNSAIKFTSKGGFEISMDCTVEWEVLPQDMPGLVKEYGDHHKLEENVIKLQAQAISRAKGIDYGVQEFLEGARREKFQADFTRELVLKCSEKNVAVRSAFIRDIVIPEEYLKPIRAKQIALETELTNQAAEATADSLTKVERERELVVQRVAEVKAETARIVAAIDRDVENIGTRTHAEIDKLKADYGAQIAALEAQRSQVLGEAAAEVTKLKDTAKNSLYQMKMEVFQNDPNAFLRYTLADSLNPKMSVRLMHSGPGTFWTNMDGKNLSLMMPASGANAPKPAPK